MSFIEHQREHITMQWFLDQTEAARQGLEDIQAVTASGSILQEPLLYLARLGDLTRSNSFLWTETLCKTLEHYSRVFQMGQERSREFVLSTLAADILVGYLTLNSRRQMFPYLVQAADWEWQHQRSAKRIRYTAAELGGVLIKACQFASTRPDLLPATYVQMLATLQDRIQPHPWSEMEKVIRQELGCRPEQVFSWIEQEPVASASIAQVHRARLLDGQMVAIKIQYPEIQNLIEVDLTVLQGIVDEMRRLVPGIQLQPILATYLCH